MSVTIAYLAQGKLYLKNGDAAARLIESQFAQQAVERDMRTRQRNEWKTRGKGGPDLFSSRLLWRADLGDPAARRIDICGVTRGADGELVFALDTDHVGGLFLHDTADGSERRLFHRNRFRCRDLARHPSQELVALSLINDDGSANLALTAPDGKGMREVTEGDSVDQAPAWIPGGGEKLVFQSAGVGRNKMGHLVALGPYAIQKLDLDAGSMDTLLEDEGTDYLTPRMAADGALYYIRRPYKMGGLYGSVSPWKVAQDALLFPFRFAYAIVHFLNYFSNVFANKPLLTAGGPQQPPQDRKYMMLWGKMIDAEEAMKSAKKTGAAPPLVPKTWELVKQTKDGNESILAAGVVSFDLVPDGGVIYTDGSSVIHLKPSGEPTTLCTGKLIENVIVAG